MQGNIGLFYLASMDSSGLPLLIIGGEISQITSVITNSNSASYYFLEVRCDTLGKNSTVQNKHTHVQGQQARLLI